MNGIETPDMLDARAGQERPGSGWNSWSATSDEHRRILLEAVKRAALGAPLGLAIVCAIGMGISLAASPDGSFLFVGPGAIARFGTENMAALAQMLLGVAIGMAFAGASVAWGIEDWPTLKQLAVHFLATMPLLLGCGWLAGWAGKEASGLLGFFALQLAIYVVIAVGAGLAEWRRVRQANLLL